MSGIDEMTKKIKKKLTLEDMRTAQLNAHTAIPLIQPAAHPDLQLCNQEGNAAHPVNHTNVQPTVFTAVSTKPQYIGWYILISRHRN